MGYSPKNGFIGSSDILITSTTNTEIIPSELKSPPYDKLHCYSFSFICKEDCHFLINGTTRLFREAGVGFESGEDNPEIYSFIIEETGKSYQFTGVY